MNRIVKFRLCDLTNEELIKKVDRGTDNMYLAGEVPLRSIPARPNEDYDLLVGELIYRFGDMIKNENAEDLHATDEPQVQEVSVKAEHPETQGR